MPRFLLTNLRFVIWIPSSPQILSMGKKRDTYPNHPSHLQASIRQGFSVPLFPWGHRRKGSPQEIAAWLTRLPYVRELASYWQNRINFTHQGNMKTKPNQPTKRVHWMSGSCALPVSETLLPFETVRLNYLTDQEDFLIGCHPMCD